MACECTCTDWCSPGYPRDRNYLKSTTWPLSYLVPESFDLYYWSTAKLITQFDYSSVDKKGRLI